MWCGAGDTLCDVLDRLGGVFDVLVPVIFAVALVYFLWGLLQFFIYGGDKSSREKAIQVMIWGVIAMVIMLSVWGLVRVLSTTFQISPGGDQSPPQLNT